MSTTNEAQRSDAKITRPVVPLRRHRPRLRRPPPRGRVRPEGGAGRRLRRRRVEGGRDLRGRVVHPRRPSERRGRRGEGGPLRGDDRLLAPRRRATSSPSASRRRSRRAATPTSRSSPPPRTASCKSLRPGQLVVLESTTYPGMTEEFLPPAAREGRARRRQGHLPRVLARARRPGQRRSTASRTRRRSSAACEPRSTRLAADFYRDRRRHASSRSAAPPRPRWPSCSRTRSAASTSRSSTRSRSCATASASTSARSSRAAATQAVRLHGVPARARAPAGTASRSTRSTSRGSSARSSTARASSSWPTTSTSACRATSSSASARRSTRSARASRAAEGARARRLVQARRRRHARVAVASRSSATCCRGGAIVDYADPYVPAVDGRRDVP